MGITGSKQGNKFHSTYKPTSNNSPRIIPWKTREGTESQVSKKLERGLAAKAEPHEMITPTEADLS